MSPETQVRWGTIDAVRPEWVDLLSRPEQDRHARLGGNDQQRRFVGAAVLMREVLAELADAAPSDIGLDRACEDCGDPHGRPVPTGAAEGLHVSASHTGPFVLVAASGRPVGVDVEIVRDAPPSPPMLVRVLAEGEEAPTDPTTFAGIWSAKEAYLKAIGTGLAMPMREVSLLGDRVEHLGGGYPPGRVTPLRPPLATPPVAAHLCELDQSRQR